MKVTPLAIDLIRIDGDTQSRVGIDEDVVDDYAEVIASNGADWPFPPIDVFHDGSDYFAADGFHRLLAGHRAKRGSIPCTIHQGTARDARIFGMTANDRHGLRMTRADKRRCVEWLLDNGGKMSQAEIAATAGVGKRLVQMIVANRKPKVTPPPPPKRDTPQTATKAQNALLQPEEGEADFEATETSDDLGKCPNCAGSKWEQDDDGYSCAKCRHPWGEPAGDPDEDRIKTQRSKTVKTVEALMRAFDDLHLMLARPQHDKAIKGCKELLRIAEGWK